MECEDCGKDYLSGYVYCPFCGQPNLAMKEQAWPQLITKRIEQSWLYADVYKPHRDAIQEWSVFVFWILLCVAVAVFTLLVTGFFKPSSIVRSGPTFFYAGFGVLGLLIGVYVGLSQTPVVKDSLTAILTFVTALVVAGGTSILVGKFDRQQLQNVGLCLALLAAFAIVGAIFGMVIRTRTPMKESNRRLLHEQKDLTLRMLQTEEQILDPNTDQATVAYLQAKLTAASYALDKIAAQVPQSGQGVFAEMVTSNAASLLARPVHESLLKNKSRPLANTINDGTTEILRNVSRSLDISGETEPGSGGNSSV